MEILRPSTGQSLLNCKDCISASCLRYSLSKIMISPSTTIAQPSMLAQPSGERRGGNMHLLMGEDDQALGKALHRGLTEAGHKARWVQNGLRGFEEASSQKFDAVVLDLMLPDLPGLEVVKRMRQDGVRTPVLMLTALGSVEDRVNGLKS